MKIAESDVETTTCNRCQNRIDMGTVRVLFESDDYEEAKEARSIALARRQGFDYLADEMIEQEVLDEGVTRSVDDNVDVRARDVSPEAEAQMQRDEGTVPPGQDGDIPDPREREPSPGPTQPASRDGREDRGERRGRGSGDGAVRDADRDDGRDLGVPRASGDVEPGGVAEDDLMEEAGVDSDAVDEAGEVTSPSSEAERSPKTRIVKDAIEFLDDPTDEDVQAFAEERGVDPEYAERAVDGLCMEGEAMRTKDGVIRLL